MTFSKCHLDERLVERLRDKARLAKCSLSQVIIDLETHAQHGAIVFSAEGEATSLIPALCDETVKKQIEYLLWALSDEQTKTRYLSSSGLSIEETERRRRANISRSVRAYWESQRENPSDAELARRAKIRARMQGKQLSEEHRAAISAGIRRRASVPL